MITVKPYTHRDQLIPLLATALEGRAIPGDFATLYDADLAFGWDVLNGGWEVRTYEPRAYEVHLAVTADDEVELQKIIRSTTVTLDWDTLGMGYIVYPRSRS